MQFEWDEAKRQTNLAKHNLDFIDAPQIFAAAHVVLPTPYAGEYRELAVGMVNGRLVTVVFTMRGSACRIISMRRSREKERIEYQNIHGG